MASINIEFAIILTSLMEGGKEERGEGGGKCWARYHHTYMIITVTLTMNRANVTAPEISTGIEMALTTFRTVVSLCVCTEHGVGEEKA